MYRTPLKQIDEFTCGGGGNRITPKNPAVEICREKRAQSTGKIMDTPTDQRTPLQPFLSQHLAAGQRRSFWLGVFQKCRLITGFFPFGLVILTSMVCTVLNKSWGMGVMPAAGVAFFFVLVPSVLMKLKYVDFWKKWSKKHGYVFNEDAGMFKPILEPVDANHINTVYQLFGQLPSTVENMVLEKQLRKLKKANRLPQRWWDELAARLRTHLAPQEAVEVERVEEAAPPTTENSSSLLRL